MERGRRRLPKRMKWHEVFSPTLSSIPEEPVISSPEKPVPILISPEVLEWCRGRWPIRGYPIFIQHRSKAPRKAWPVAESA